VRFTLEWYLSGELLSARERYRMRERGVRAITGTQPTFSTGGVLDDASSHRWSPGVEIGVVNAAFTRSMNRCASRHRLLHAIYVHCCAICWRERLGN